MLGRLPKVVGIDVVEMALWAKVQNYMCDFTSDIFVYSFCTSRLSAKRFESDLTTYVFAALYINFLKMYHIIYGNLLYVFGTIRR